MAKIFIKGRREPIEVPYNTAKLVKRNWLGLDGMEKRAKDDALDLGDIYAGTYGEIKGVELQVELVSTGQRDPLEDEFDKADLEAFTKEADKYLMDGRWCMMSEMRMLKDRRICNIQHVPSHMHSHETEEEKTHCTASCFYMAIYHDRTDEYAKFQKLLRGYKEHRSRIHYAKQKEAEEWDKLGGDVKALAGEKRMQD